MTRACPCLARRKARRPEVLGLGLVLN